MTKRDHTIEVIVCHDRKGVDILTPDDCVTISVKEGMALVRRLKEALEVASRREPPAPAPLDIEEHGEAGKDFASCGKKTENEENNVVWVRGFELGIDDAIKLHEWLAKAITYLGRGDSLGGT